MVTAQIGDYGHTWAIMLNGFQRKGIHVERDEIQIAAGLADTADRRSAGSGTHCLTLGTFKHACDEYGGGRLPIRPGDCDTEAKDAPGTQLQVPPNLNIT